MIGSLETFLVSGVPALIDGKPRFKVLLASYNMIGRNRPGPVVTHDPRLSMTLFCGRTNGGDRTVSSHVRDLENDGITVSAESIREAVRAGAEGDKTLNQLSVGAALRREYIEEAQNVLLVVYAGRSPRFAPSVVEAVAFKQTYPAAAVVAVTCDCDADEKLSVLGPLVERGDLTHAVLGRDCGGHNAMQAVLDAIIDEWRTTH